MWCEGPVGFVECLNHADDTAGGGLEWGAEQGLGGVAGLKVDLGMETWFLFDANWVFTSQSRDLISQYCTDIVPIGRLIWIPDTQQAGKDDSCWYRFDPNKAIPGPANMHPARPPKSRKKKVKP